MSEQRINIIVEPEFKKQVAHKAIDEGRTITEVVISLLKQWLKRGQK